MPVKKEKEILTIHNKISPSYRELYIDGAYGGVTPRGHISLSFFAERFPIPKSTDFEIDVTKSSMTKISDSNDSKTGVLREYEIGIYMTLESAKSLSDMLQKKVLELEELQSKKKA
jgi:hypothetical protein